MSRVPPHQSTWEREYKKKQKKQFKWPSSCWPYCPCWLIFVTSNFGNLYNQSALNTTTTKPYLKRFILRWNVLPWLGCGGHDSGSYVIKQWQSSGVECRCWRGNRHAHHKAPDADPESHDKARYQPNHCALTGGQKQCQFMCDHNNNNKSRFKYWIISSPKLKQDSQWGLPRGRTFPNRRVPTGVRPPCQRYWRLPEDTHEKLIKKKIK